MIVLGIETSTARSSVALVVDGECVAHEVHEDARGHGAFLAPAMRQCLSAIPSPPGSVDAVAVGVGPGLYTGLRVGMATAAAFCSARALPIVGCSGLDTLAQSDAARIARDGDLLVTTIDARRGQVFWAVHRREGGSSRLLDGPRVGSPADFERVLHRPAHDGAVHVIGEVGAEEIVRPDAVDTARCAVPVLEAEPWDTLTPQALAPVYLREADVRIGWTERGGVRVGGGSDR